MLQLPLKYNRSVKSNICKEWIKEMQAYILYYEKHNVFANKKEKIDFAQGYLKDMAKCV